MKAALLFLFAIFTAPRVWTLGSDQFSSSQLVDVVELDVERRSSESHERKFSIHAFGEDHNLNLIRSHHFLPETLPVHFIDVDSEGKRVIEDYTHRTGGRQHLYSDLDTGASLLIDEVDGNTKLSGRLRDSIFIEPLVGEEYLNGRVLPSNWQPIRHKVYRANSSNGYYPIDDVVPQEFVDAEVESVAKRSIPSKIYPAIHAVVDYSHYKKLARTEKQVLDYIKILYHTAQVAHFSTMSNPTCQISLQGITVCKSEAACAELNKGKWSYSEYKYPFDNINRYAYQERGRTGTNYAIMFVTTSNKICTKPGECGVGGFGPMPGACAAFDSRTQMSNRGGIMIDHGAYDAVRGLGHEIGHMLNMPHDGDSNYPYAVSCKGGTPSGDYIMGQTQYSPNNWRFSSCSMYYLHQFLQKSSSSCLRSPPSYNLIQGWGDTVLAGKYMYADNQCKAIWGSDHVSCQNTATKNDQICQKLGCSRQNGGYCGLYHLAAAEGTRCGPGLHCMKGYCVNDPTSSSGTSGSATGNTGSSSSSCTDNHNDCQGSFKAMFQKYAWYYCKNQEAIKLCCATWKQMCP